MKNGLKFKDKGSELKSESGEIIIGTLTKHKKGFGFVIPETSEEAANGDVFVAARYLSDAMHGDKVAVKVFESKGEGKREGEISTILKRGVQEVVGSFQKNKKFGFVVPADPKLTDDIFIKKKDFKSATTGDNVVVQISKYPENGNSAEGKITEIISKRGEVGGDVKALIRSKGLFKTFPSMVNAEAKAVSKQGEPEEKELKRRVDLRTKTIITIDGADSKDLDDAVSIEKLDSGNYVLGVHIADVTHYVAEGGPLDKEALKRGNSVYLIDQVIPMLPKELSNGICSLHPEMDRLTLSIDMEIDDKGDVVKHHIYESVINSTARMTYTDVSDILEKQDAVLIEKYQFIYKELIMMGELAQILNSKRKSRGSLDFDFDEASIVLNEEGIPTSIEIAERRIANKLIEEFMLMANETIAEHFFWLEAPFVYRVHEKPALEKMEEFKAFIMTLGLMLKGNPENIHPRTLNEILLQAAGKPYENVVSTVMLRSMRKAFYGTTCEGHFGLSVKYYCHFTSPIRRYPDLIIHRIIKESINGGIDEKRIKSLKKKTEEASEIASVTERKAQELEREVEKLKKAEYMIDHVGEIFEGIVSGVTGFGFYVELPNTIEGMVRAASLNDDFYDHEQSKYRLIGRRTNKTYTLGDTVSIKVHNVSIEDRQIDFTIA